MTSSIRQVVLTVLAATSVSACLTPYADRLSAIDWDAEPALGTITVSQPRLYRRASLINERRLDADWINDLLEESKKVEFKPELARELEQITVFAAALGLSFDPASKLNYRRATETGDLQQDIQVMKLQLQLDQLKRDAQLVRDKLDVQTDPVNSDLGTITADSPQAAASPITAAAVDQLTAAIETLTKNLTSRLDVEGKPVSLAQTGVNPTQEFKDRLAYREVLKAARNSAALDDLHDYGGSALIRLNFQAMVLPDRNTSNIPGVVQMKIKPPEDDPLEMEWIYLSWLDYVNKKLNQPEASETARRIIDSPASENFDRFYLQYGKSDCSPFVFSISELDTSCKHLTFAVPKFEGKSIQEGASASLEDYYKYFDLSKDDDSDHEAFVANHQIILTHAKTVVSDCGFPSARHSSDGEPGEDRKLMDAIGEAQIRVAAGKVLGNIFRDARWLLEPRDASALGKQVQRIEKRATLAKQLLLTFEKAAYADCSEADLKAFRDSAPRGQVPERFVQALKDYDRVAIYDLGPREQVQQVSTVSRMADNLSLAVSLATSVPGSGAAGNAATNFARQSTGKASALERVPGLVGYSVDRTFGWVLGPQAKLDPDGALTLEHAPRTLDLSVDLSVPGWWRSLIIETTTAWAASRHAVVSGSVKLLGAEPLEMRIPLESSEDDFQVLTTRLMRGDVSEMRTVTLEPLDGQSVSACRSTHVYLKGNFIWRAEAVLIGGYQLDQGAISVSPDMGGILLKVPALGDLIADDSADYLQVRVLTRYGDKGGRLKYVGKPSAGSCAAAASKATETDKPVITSIEPKQFSAGAGVEFRIVGSKLKQLTSVTINGQPGTLEPIKGETSARAKFSTAQTASLPISREISLRFYKDDKKIHETMVEVTGHVGAQ